MNLNDAAKARLRRGPLSCFGMLENLRRGAAEVLAAGEEGVLLRVRGTGILLLQAASPRQGLALLRAAPDFHTLAAYGAFAAQAAAQHPGLAFTMSCREAVYPSPRPPAFTPPAGIRLGPLPEEHLPLAARQYMQGAEAEYITRRFRAGALTGAFSEGQLAGFAGLHEEGSIGLLEVLPAFRRRGVGSALCAHLVGACLARGWRPFAHIQPHNSASLALHRRLGYRLSPTPLCWLSRA